MFAVSNTLLSEQLWSFWLLLLVILVERYVSWPDKYHPISFLKVLAMGMQRKVLAFDKSSIRQQKISGTLACLVLLLPFSVILVVFTYLSEYPIFFDAIMLLVALRFQDIPKKTSRVTAALLKQQKILARQTLAQIVLRETHNMSPIGVVKANIESLLLRYSYQYCSVIFWYLVTGGIGALLYRLMYELSMCWNTKLAKFRYFGQPARNLVNLMQWIPSTLASISVVIAVNIRQGIQALFQATSYQSTHFFILNLCGASLDLELGGPAYYEDKKIRRPKSGGHKQVILADNKRALSAIQRATWVWLTLYFMGCAIAFLLSKS